MYPEIKSPAWHRSEGIDISVAVLGELARHGYETADDPIYLQCFDASEVLRIRNELGCRLRMVQLIGENDWSEAETDYDAMRAPAGIEDLANTVDGIGPWLQQLYAIDDRTSKRRSTGLTELAHEAGLEVHPYTFRADALPPGFSCFEGLVRYFREELGVDGVFTDFPDRVRRLM